MLNHYKIIGKIIAHTSYLTTIDKYPQEATYYFRDKYIGENVFWIMTNSKNSTIKIRISEFKKKYSKALIGKIVHSYNDLISDNKIEVYFDSENKGFVLQSSFLNGINDDETRQMFLDTLDDIKATLWRYNLTHLIDPDYKTLYRTYKPATMPNNLPLPNIDSELSDQYVRLYLKIRTALEVHGKNKKMKSFLYASTKMFIAYSLRALQDKKLTSIEIAVIERKITSITDVFHDIMLSSMYKEYETSSVFTFDELEPNQTSNKNRANWLLKHGSIRTLEEAYYKPNAEDIIRLNELSTIADSAYKSVKEDFGFPSSSEFDDL